MCSVSHNFKYFYFLLINIVLIVQCEGALSRNSLYRHGEEFDQQLPKQDEVSSPEVKLLIPIVFYHEKYLSIFVNANGMVSFQTEIPSFFNVQFPLDYPIIAPLYTNVDIRTSGIISYRETQDSVILSRATQTVRDHFKEAQEFSAKSVFIATWTDVGYHDNFADKVNTYQMAILNNGTDSYAEFLYPENGIQWIQGTGGESGLPDARAQVGFVSPEGVTFTLPGSGTDKVFNMMKRSNMNSPGQWIFHIGTVDNIQQPDFDNNLVETILTQDKKTCADISSECHSQATCLDSIQGFCCICQADYYGNGKSCLKKDIPLRVNGKVSGKINNYNLNQLDLQSYIVMSDGRSYTAISRVPREIGWSFQLLQILGNIIGFLFAKPMADLKNGYQITGGIFNHTATLRFRTGELLKVSHTYSGLDVFDQLRLEAHVQGSIPNLPENTKIVLPDYEQEYAFQANGIILSQSSHSFKNSESGEDYHFTIDQNINFSPTCQFFKQGTHQENEDLNCKLKISKTFIGFEDKEQIIRFGLSSKVIQISELDQCKDGQKLCGGDSICETDGDSYKCVCNPGFQYLFNNDHIGICADINECQVGLHNCDVNANCYNEPGRFSCECKQGFEGNGHICHNVQTCADIYCPEHAECIETEFGLEPHCVCMQGYKGDGLICLPNRRQSCDSANNCSPYGTCILNEETHQYECSCLPGFIGNGYNCNSVSSPDELEHFTTTDFTLITRQDTDITTSSEKKVNRVVEQCLLGVCWCPNEYIKEKGTIYCYQAKEHPTPTTEMLIETTVITQTETQNNKEFDCSIDSNSCSNFEECIFSLEQEKFICNCREGYIRNNKSGICHTKEEQWCGAGKCVEHATCLYDSDYQAYYCLCDQDYIGDGITECKPRPLGCDQVNNCGLHAECLFEQDFNMFTCQCKDGYFGDGFICSSERTCYADPYLCDLQATCVINSDRQHICKCNEGYSGNGTFCKLSPKHNGNFLLLNQGMATLRVPFTPTIRDSGNPIQIQYYQMAIGLDVDCYEGRVYWSDITGKAIKSSAYNGTNYEDFLINDIGSPEGLSIDWISRNIYWTDSLKDTLEVANLETKLRKVLFKDNLVNPRGVAVHPQRGKLFWSDWNRRAPKIEYANMDGTERAVFLEGTFVQLPNSLAIDWETDSLCYADAGTKKIECVKIDTKEIRTIAVNCSYPFGLAISDERYYWTDWTSQKIESVDKITLQRQDPIKVPLGGSGNKLYGLSAVPEQCPTLTNVCHLYNGQCSTGHLCLPSGYGRRSCVCAANDMCNDI